ncbi:MAG TPA: hypothetical protein VH741_07445, partial [Candidatus Limnocylindrales bacterium]
ADAGLAEAPPATPVEAEPPKTRRTRKPKPAEEPPAAEAGNDAELLPGGPPPATEAEAEPEQ